MEGLERWSAGVLDLGFAWDLEPVIWDFRRGEAEGAAPPFCGVGVLHLGFPWDLALATASPSGGGLGIWDFEPSYENAWWSDGVMERWKKYKN